MNELLLVLLLITDPSAQPAADAVSQRLTDSGARVVVGAEALTLLKERGVTDADLTSQAAVGPALTTKDRKLAVVRLDRQFRGGNVTIESQVWAAGSKELHVAIAGTTHLVPGKDGAPDRVVPDEPIDSVARGVGTILAPWLAASGTAPAQEVEGQLASLSDKADWKRIIEITEAREKPSPRIRYYRVIALMRSERAADAETAYQEFAKAAPNHVLLAALDDLLHPKAKADGSVHDINEEQPADDGSNVLR